MLRVDAHDNSEIVKKAAIRRLFSDDVASARTYLPACGRGRMLSSVWCEKSDYVLALDCDERKIAHLKYHYPDVDARVADIHEFDAWPAGVRFNVADFDVYGSPYQAIEHFFATGPWTAPFLAVVTDGVPLWLERGGFLPPQFRQEATARRLLDPALRKSYFDSIVWPWWGDFAGSHSLAVDRQALTWKKGRTLAYYAIRLVARDAADFTERSIRERLQP